MFTENQIKENLSVTNELKDKGDFVAIFVTVNDKGQAEHSGLIISFKSLTYYLHYNREKVLFDLTNFKTAERVYHKKLEIIDKKLIPAFITHCRIISHTAAPKYGYFYGGSFYKNGEYHSNHTTPQLMTCVGFCMNVLTGFVEEKNYLEFTDWEPVSEGAEKYFTDFVITLTEKYSNLDISELRKEFRRIKPSELISAGYFNKMPIRKIQTDQVKPILEELFKSSI